MKYSVLSYFHFVDIIGHYMEHYLAEVPFPFFESHTTAPQCVLLQTVLNSTNE